MSASDIVKVVVLTGIIVYLIAYGWWRWRRRGTTPSFQPTQTTAGTTAQAPTPQQPTPTVQAATTPTRPRRGWSKGILWVGVILLGGTWILAYFCQPTPAKPAVGTGQAVPIRTAEIPPAIDIRGPYTPGPSDWDHRNVIRWWEVIIPGNAPGWQPRNSTKGIPITVPWRKFLVRYQSGSIRTPYGSWPPSRNEWPDPTAEQLLANIPGATARDLACPQRWYGELVGRVVNAEQEADCEDQVESRGGNYLWNATVDPHNVAVVSGSRPGYLQFAINVPQGKERTELVRRNSGAVVFEVMELDEYVPEGSYYPAPPMPERKVR